MDPIGFSLENFDAIGQWRTADQGAPIDASGVLADGTTINGPSALLAVPRRAARTVRPHDDADADDLRAWAARRNITTCRWSARIERDAAKQNYRFSALVLGIVNSAPFQMQMTRRLESELEPAGRQSVTAGASK